MYTKIIKVQFINNQNYTFFLPKNYIFNLFLGLFSIF